MMPPEVFGGNPPQGLAYVPERTFLVTRQLPNGNELFLDAFSVDEQLSNEAVVRVLVNEYLQRNRTNNPAWQIVIYCPTNDPDPWYSAGDICWVSWGSE